jgi:hypothetical protein
MARMNKLQAGNFIKIVVLLIIIILIGYSLGNRVIGPQLKNLNILNSKPTPTIAPVDLTADWLSYNDASGFNLKYPKTLSVNKINDQSVLIGNLKIEVKEGVMVPAGDKITIGTKEAVWIQNGSQDIVYLPMTDGKNTLVATKPQDEKGSDNTLFRIIDSIRFN